MVMDTFPKKPSLSSSFTSTLKNEILPLLQERRTKRVCFLLVFCLVCYFLLLAWSSSTCSMALLAYTYTVGFNLLSLLTCILSVWVERQSPTPLFSFGYERFEVLAVFASTILAQLASLFIIKESIERLVLEQPEIHTGRLLVGVGVAFVSHLVVIYGCNNTALAHVVAASSSSWLQEHVSDISQSVCSVLPVLSGLLLPRINPMLLIACAGGISLVVTDFLIELKNFHVVDTLAAISTALMMCATMLPMSVYSGKVLLQTTPSHMVGQLDKCLRETLTIDGVLEFRNEHFWTLSFGKMAGSLQVRVRRDANEQLVLAHVVDRLSSVVSVLTVQVFKDEWARRGVGAIPPLPDHSSFVANHTLLQSTPTTVNSTMTHPVNVIPVLSSDNKWVNSNSRSPIGAGSGIVIPSHSKLPHSGENNTKHFISSSVQNLNSIPTPVNNFSKVPSLSNISFPPPTNNMWYSKPTDSTSVSTNIAPQRKNPFLPDFSLPSPTPSRSPQANLLISGTRTLDAERFTYKPR
ncbi:zinc transporter 6 isoform X1 [Anabrus simplex]|uniref:zinc transporter 6 isoform X1 n=1 Tax=Anabrus simplex TaxID=316456 RepID=UPI0035A27DCA